MLLLLRSPLPTQRVTRAALLWQRARLKLDELSVQRKETDLQVVMKLLLDAEEAV